MIAVHGLGYVGLTAAVYWAQSGEQVVGYDPDPSVILAIRSGQPKHGDFLNYLKDPVEDLVNAGLLVASNSLSAVVGARVHIVAVPTERDDKPDMSIIEAVLNSLVPMLGAGDSIWIESTLVPGTIDAWMAKQEPWVKEGFETRVWNLVVAPRRDWFADPERNMKTLPRIVGGYHPRSSFVAMQQMQRVCDTVIPTHYRTAEFVKPLENALLHVPVMLMHELAVAFPDVDVAEALRLAGTHWRFQSMNPMYVGFGTGGRCVPLGTRYLLEASANADPWGHQAAIREDSVGMEGMIREVITTWAIERAGPEGLVLVAGIAYRPGFKDAGHSPGRAIARNLKASNHPVQVHDPRWADRELLTVTGVEPGTMGPHVKVLLLATAHPEYSDWPLQDALWAPGQYVLDAHGSWAKHQDRFAQRGVSYAQAATPGWLRPV